MTVFIVPKLNRTIAWRERIFRTLDEISATDPDLINTGSRVLVMGLLPRIGPAEFDVLWEDICIRQAEVRALDGWPDDLAVSRERLESEIRYLMGQGSVV